MFPIPAAMKREDLEQRQPMNTRKLRKAGVRYGFLPGNAYKQKLPQKARLCDRSFLNIERAIYLLWTHQYRMPNTQSGCKKLP